MTWDPKAFALAAEEPKVSRRKLTIVTNSEVQAFRDCPHKWGLAYEEGLRPKTAPRALSFGTAVHAGLAAAIRAPLQEAVERGVEAATRAQHEWFASLLTSALSSDQLDSLAAEAESAVSMAKWMIQHYVSKFEEDWRWLVPLGVEKAFTVRAVNAAGTRVGHLGYSGVWDLVAYDRRHGDVVTMDHKTTSGSVDGIDKRVELDPQIAGYVWALRRVLWHSESRFGESTIDLSKTGLTQAEVRRIVERDVQTGRVIYNVLRKKQPSVPKINKDGRVSIAAIDTTSELYEGALTRQREAGLPVTPEQSEVLLRLSGRGDAFLSRREFFRSTDEIARWRNELFIDAARVRHAQEDPQQRTRNPGNCTMPWSMPCSYRNICLHPSSPEFRIGFVVTPRHVEVEQAREEEA